MDKNSINVNMKNIDNIIEQLSSELGSLDYSFLTEKEIDRALLFLSDISEKNRQIDNNGTYTSHPELAVKSCSGLINGMNNYLLSLRAKVKKRKTIPNWYLMNKI